MSFLSLTSANLARQTLKIESVCSPPTHLISSLEGSERVLIKEIQYIMYVLV